MPALGCSPPTGNYSTDVAIIGSGPAGLSLASRLTQAGIKVIVIESGPLDGYSEHAQQRNKVLDAGLGLPYPLGAATKRMTGGTSSVWGGHCPRFRADDLLCKSRFGYAEDWPITYKELENYYCQAERFLSVFNGVNPCNPIRLTDNSFNLAQYLQAQGFKETVAASVTVNADGEYQPLRLKQSHLPNLLNNKNFTLLNDLTARNFEIDKTGKVKSVLCTDNEGIDKRINCKALVICAGAIQSSRFLMLVNNQHSGFDFGSDGGHLGANFMDHNAVQVTVNANGQPSGIKRQISQGPQSIQYGQAHIWQWYGRYREQGVGAYMPLAVLENESTNTTSVPEKNIRFSILCEQEPSLENRFELSKTEQDEFGDPLPMLWYKLSDFDKRTYTHAAESLKNTLEMSKTLESSQDMQVYFGRHHLMGTTRMADNEKEGVVDKNLKVFGSKNIYVLGGSVFPSGGAANPTLTIVALAMRLSEHLIQSSI